MSNVGGRQTSGRAVTGTTSSSMRLGTPGRLAILLWSLVLASLSPPDRLLLACGLALATNVALYPAALSSLRRWRWLLFAALLILPNALWLGQADWTLAGVPVSSAGLAAGLRMALRMVVVLVAVDGFAGAVDIGQVAGLLERLGLPGLGFSLGVATNLLPALNQSAGNAWDSLKMRGGLRRRWWRGLRLLLVTVMASALRRAEEIALAAEARAFQPGQSRPLPVQRGAWDWVVLVGLLASGALLLLG